jgi:hypothetical protein
LALDADRNVFVIGAVDGAGTERWEVIRDELNRYTDCRPERRASATPRCFTASVCWR